MVLIRTNWNSNRSLLAGLLAFFLVACDTAERSSTDPTVTSDPNVERVPVIRNQSTHSIPVEFSVGTIRFVAPTEVVGFGVGYQGEVVDSVTLGVYFPDFEGGVNAAVKERSHYIQIFVRHRSDGMPFELPTTLEEAEAVVESRFPTSHNDWTLDQDLGLIEIRNRRGSSIVRYRQSNDYLRPSDGLIPTLNCHVNVNYCQSQGFIRPDVSVSYRFPIGQLSNWPEIDKGVFNLLEQYRQEVS